MARRKKPLSDDDREIWEVVKTSLTPMHPQKKKLALPQPKVAPMVAKTKPLARKTLTKIGRSAAEPLIRFDLAPDPMLAVGQQKPVMDQRTHGKMRKGKLKPEARLDLHGMRAAQAQDRLKGFIKSCHSDGKRLVLVITGKGSTNADDGGIMPSRTGILRQSLPQWLSAADMRGLILQITPAHLRHGGGGAYYVYLKRKGRP